MSLSNEFGEELVDEVLHQQSVVSRLSGELNEIREVLKWASENVSLLRNMNNKTWSAAWDLNNFTVQPTLYEALWSAWKSRDAATEQRKDK